MLTNYNYLKLTTSNLTTYSNTIIYKKIFDGTPYRSFNTSIIQIDENNYLCLVRIAISADRIPIMPGNSKRCKPSLSDNGNNFFWWNNWGWSQGGTLFVHYNSITNDFKEIKIIEINTNISKKILGSDIRICKINDIIYFYKNDLELFIECTYDKDTYTLTISNIINFNFDKKTGAYIGQNFAPFDIIIINDMPNLLYLDWFYGDHFLIRQLAKSPLTYTQNTDNINLINKINYNTSVKNIKIKFNESFTGFYGEGSYETGKPKDIEKYKSFYGITPGFSFTTPHIEINDNGKRCWIGVGHTKIRNPAEIYPYEKHSKIEQFRYNLHNKMFSKYGDNYKLNIGHGKAPDNCYGYIYLIYFYKLIYNSEDDYDMFISDSYLPLDLNDNTQTEYKFSLIFPMGIIKQKIEGRDVLKVSCGEGDYNSIILDFDYSEVMKSIDKDIKSFDIRTYEYYLLLYKNGISIKNTLANSEESITDLEVELNYIISKTIPKTIPEGNSSLEPDTELHFLNKYLKYKNKYLKLKYLT